MPSEEEVRLVAKKSTEWLTEMVATMGVLATREWMNVELLHDLAVVLDGEPPPQIKEMVEGARIAVRVFSATAREMTEANAMLEARRQKGDTIG